MNLIEIIIFFIVFIAICLLNWEIKHNPDLFRGVQLYNFGRKEKNEKKE